MMERNSQQPRLALLARVLLGSLFSFTGANGFLHFMPMSSGDVSQGALSLSTALMQSGYLMQMVMATQLITGIMLLFNLWVPFALVLLAPIVVNIFTFHVFLAPAGLPLALFVCVLEVLLAWSFRRVYAPLFRIRA
ncbi:MAG TPA: DoxX family membrane protein [Fibrobacteraceae bacterium]|nr:DoxX family membrane protein [Fibrobacteraceae bacterium]